MFDIGFWELAVIGVVALLVIGPERLPKVARTAGLWFGKARRFVTSVKADIEKEIRADELKRIMDEQARSSGIHEILDETRETFGDVQRDLDKTRSELDELERETAANLSDRRKDDEAAPVEPPASEPAPKSDER